MLQHINIKHHVCLHCKFCFYVKIMLYTYYTYLSTKSYLLVTGKNIYSFALLQKVILHIQT